MQAAGFLDGIKLFFRQTWTVGSRDIVRLLRRPLFSAFTGLSCLFLSVLFGGMLFRFSEAYSSPFPQQGPGQSIHAAVFMPHVGVINLLLLFCAPLLAMSLLAEEKKSRSFDLLMTAPLSSLHIAAGKYLALLALLLLFVLISLVYPLSTAFFAEIPFGLLFSAYAGLALLAALYAAIGLFASSLTSSLFFSFFGGIILILSLWFFAQGQDFQSPALSAAMDYLSVSGHLEELAQGHVLLSSLAFFLSAAVFFLFLVHAALEFARWRP